MQHSFLGDALGRLMTDESGQGLIEYALTLALVAIAVIVALHTLGQKINAILTNAANALP